MNYIVVVAASIRESWGRHPFVGRPCEAFALVPHGQGGVCLVIQESVHHIVKQDLLTGEVTHRARPNPDHLAVHDAMTTSDERLVAILRSPLRHPVHHLVPRRGLLLLRRVDVDEVVPCIRAVVVVAFAAVHHFAPPEPVHDFSLLYHLVPDLLPQFEPEWFHELGQRSPVGGMAWQYAHCIIYRVLCAGRLEIRICT